MVYLGSKRRIAKFILPIMLRERGDRPWVEPFVGGANMIDRVEGGIRIGADIHGPLIEALKLIRDAPETLPDAVSEEEYQTAKMLGVEDGLTGYIGFALSFGAKWWGGYARNAQSKNYAKSAKNSALRQSPKLQGVEFVKKSYNELPLPPNSFIYCDPPYQGSTGYKHNFDHEKFWHWCREKTTEGHIVYVSEYAAPEDFLCVWERDLLIPINNHGKTKTGTEKLFTYL